MNQILKRLATIRGEKITYTFICDNDITVCENFEGGLDIDLPLKLVIIFAVHGHYR